MKKKASFDYFDSFIRYADKAVAAAECLSRALTAYDREREAEYLAELHQIEQEADSIRHQTIDQLAREFLPPIEREDIVSLCHELDNVVDSIEDVLRQICLYQMPALRSEVAEFCDLLTRCCKSLQTLTAELPRFKRSTAIRPALVELNSLEGEGDELHFRTVRALFAGADEPLTKMVWKNVFDSFETCYDACEHVGNAIESAVLKNT